MIGLYWLQLLSVMNNLSTQNVLRSIKSVFKKDLRAHLYGSGNMCEGNSLYVIYFNTCNVIFLIQLFATINDKLFSIVKWFKTQSLTVDCGILTYVYITQMNLPIWSFAFQSFMTNALFLLLVCWIIDAWSTNEIHSIAKSLTTRVTT